MIPYGRKQLNVTWAVVSATFDTMSIWWSISFPVYCAGFGEVFPDAEHAACADEHCVTATQVEHTCGSMDFAIALETSAECVCVPMPAAFSAFALLRI